jgi:hypothetical protein
MLYVQTVLKGVMFPAIPDMNEAIRGVSPDPSALRGKVMDVLYYT